MEFNTQSTNREKTKTEVEVIKLVTRNSDFKMKSYFLFIIYTDEIFVNEDENIYF